MYTGLNVKYPLLFSDFNNLEFSLDGYEKYSDIKFHKNPPSESRVVPCGRAERQT